MTMRVPLMFAAALAAVGVSANALAQSGAPAVSACSLNVSPDVSEQRLTSDGRERTFRLFVPASYDGRTALPLVLDLHGSGSTAAGQAGTSRFEALAASEGFVVASLQAGTQG